MIRWETLHQQYWISRCKEFAFPKIKLMRSVLPVWLHSGMQLGSQTVSKIIDFTYIRRVWISALPVFDLISDEKNSTAFHCSCCYFLFFFCVCVRNSHLYIETKVCSGVSKHTTKIHVALHSLKLAQTIGITIDAKAIVSPLSAATYTLRFNAWCDFCNGI